MDRRQFLIRFTALALAAKSGLAQSSSSQKMPYTLPLWTSTPPGGGGPVGEIRVSAKGAQSHIAIPYLTVLEPLSPKGHGVLIAAGGGYKRIEMEM